MIGLAAAPIAQLCTLGTVIAVDRDPARLQTAQSLGADVTAGADEDPEQLVADLTDGLGADVVIEAVGVPETFEACLRMVRPGASVANIGGARGHPLPCTWRTCGARTSLSPRASSTRFPSRCWPA